MEDYLENKNIEILGIYYGHTSHLIDEVRKLYEPNYLKFKDLKTGYTCIASRHESLGFFRGYVSIPRSNKLYGIHYSDVDDIDVHGGLTFSGEIDFLGFVLGFDCGHHFDLVPRKNYKNFKIEEKSYKNIYFVIKECLFLAKQAQK